MGKRFWSYAVIIALFFMSIACSGFYPTRLEMDYGTSVKLAQFNQILYPEAVKNLDPVTGLDGEAAKATMDKYHKSFEAPAPAPIYMFGFGGGASK